MSPREFLIDAATREYAGEADFEEDLYVYLEAGGQLADLIEACSNFHEDHPMMAHASDLLKLYLKGTPYKEDN